MERLKGNKMKPLWKHVIVIWAEEDLCGLTLEELGYESDRGSAYCSVMTSGLVDDPEEDPSWDGTEFFMDNEEVSGEE